MLRASSTQSYVRKFVLQNKCHEVFLIVSFDKMLFCVEFIIKRTRLSKLME